MAGDAPYLCNELLIKSFKRIDHTSKSECDVIAVRVVRLNDVDYRVNSRIFADKHVFYREANLLAYSFTVQSTAAIF